MAFAACLCVLTIWTRNISSQDSDTALCHFPKLIHLSLARRGQFSAQTHTHVLTVKCMFNLAAGILPRREVLMDGCQKAVTRLGLLYFTQPH